MRPEKASIVSDLSEKLKRSPFVLVTDYQHMKVGDFGELRNRLAPTGAEVHVVKNNFLKRAMTDSGFPDVGDKLVGQTAVVTGEKDVAPVAKIFKTFATEFKIAALKIGFVDRALAFYGGIGNVGGAAATRSFAGATAGAALVSGNASRPFVERTRLRAGAGVKCKGAKGRKASGGNSMIL